MQLNINNQTVLIPTTLAEITLGQRIAFHDQYGKTLDAKLKSIQAMEDEELKLIALDMLADERAIAFLAFYSGLTVEEVTNYVPAEYVLIIDSFIQELLVEEESKIIADRIIVFDNEEWHLQPTLISRSHPLTAGEYVDAKQIIKDLITEERSSYEVLHRLACIFLRKYQEPYNPLFVEAEHERYQKLLQLPLDAALQVGFFLNNWIQAFKTHSAALNHPEVSQEGI